MTTPEVEKAETPDATEEISRWVTAAADTRSTAKWIIASLAAIAGVVFGAGPIVSRPELSWTENSAQLVIATILGAIGLIAIVVLISEMASVLTPAKLTLTTLPASARAELNAAPDQLLPSDAKNYAGFLRRLRLHEQLAVQLPEEARKISEEMSTIEDKSAPSYKQLEAALRSIQAAAEVSIQNRTLYRETARRVLDRAEYAHVADQFKNGKPLIVGLAIASAVGALGFQMALSSSKPSDKVEGSKPASEIAYLSRIAGQSDSGLWDALQLDRCTNADNAVPVLLTGGNGSQNEPYSVTTLQLNSNCPVQSFTVIGSMIAVRTIPAQKITISYVPSTPTPSTSSTR